MNELLLRHAQRGNAAAFEQLITPYESLVWRVCYHYTGHQEDARDCAQEAMLKAWRSIAAFRQDCSLETWLYRIAASCCLDFLRKRKRHTAESADQLAETGFDPPDPSPQPEEIALQRDEKAQLRQALKELPEDMRTCLIMSAMEGLKYDQIAQVMNIAPGTVKSRINRARLRLAQILAQKQEPSGANCVQSSERRTLL